MRRAWLWSSITLICLGNAEAAASPLAEIVETASRDGVEIPLISEGGGLYVQVQLNDRITAKMLLDTGASDVIIPQQIARMLRLNEDGPAKQLRTLSGTTTARMVTLNKVGVGPARATEVQAVVFNTNPELEVGLLGRSFLNNFNYSVDMDRLLLVLKPRNDASVEQPMDDEYQPRAVELVSDKMEATGSGDVAGDSMHRLEKDRTGLEPTLQRVITSAPAETLDPLRPFSTLKVKKQETASDEMEAE